VDVRREVQVGQVIDEHVEAVAVTSQRPTAAAYSSTVPAARFRTDSGAPVGSDSKRL
jgi:hypothetical protein